MNAYKTASDWTRNKNSSSIIYMDSEGVEIEITLELFLADSPKNTVEMFAQIKGESDKLFHAEDSAERKRSKCELPLLQWCENCASETLEDDFFNSINDEQTEILIVRRKQMLFLAPEVLDTLTETQRRRFLLHKVNGLSTRKIAETEGVTQPAVVYSIVGAENKIKKVLLKLGKITCK